MKTRSTVIFLYLLIIPFVNCSNGSSKKLDVANTKDIEKLKSNDLPLPNEILKNGWDRIVFKNTGNIDIPPTLELQAGEYKKFVDSLRKTINIEATDLVFQQKELNTMSKEGFKKYARVMIDIIDGQNNEYEKINAPLSVYTAEFMKEFETAFKEQFIKESEKMNIKLTEWFPAKGEIVNGMNCLHVCYKRQLLDNPIVVVNLYMFPNYNQLIKLTLSHRIIEEDFWREDFKTVLKSFRITNIH